MSKQSFTTGQVLTAAQVNSLQENDYNQTVSVKTANYTLAAADKGTRIEFNTSGSVTCTVNSGLFDAGDTLVIQNRGAGVVTVTAGTATVNTSATLALSQYDAGTLYFISNSASIFFNTDAGGGSPLTTKGDLYGFSTVDARIPIGANNTVLTADSSESLGLKWAAPAGGGKVLQVVSATTTTDTSITSTSFTDTTITATITPSSATSKVLILVTAGVFASRTATSNLNNAQIVRGVTVVTDFGNQGFFNGLGIGGATSTERHDIKAFHFLDSPSSTSSLVYKVQGRVTTAANSNTIRFQPDSTLSSILLLEIGA
jgi:hypothetical protein